MPKYLTTVELAELVRTPIETVRYWRHIGKGPRSFKVGRRVLYAAEDVEAFIGEARKAEANVHAGGAALALHPSVDSRPTSTASRTPTSRPTSMPPARSQSPTEPPAGGPTSSPSAPGSSAGRSDQHFPGVVGDV